MRFLLLAIALPAMSNAQPLVATKPVAEVGIISRYEALAEVISPNQTQISAEVTGVVMEVLADVADTVKAGQVLVRLDAADLELDLAQANGRLSSARARLTQAELRLERAERLSSNQFVSDDDLLERKTSVLIEEAEVKRLIAARTLAERRLDDATIRAPFDAAVTGRDVQVGQLLTPGSPVIALVELNRPEVIAQVPGADRDSLKYAEVLELKTDSGTYPVKLISQAPVILAGSRTSPARLQFVDEAEWPGATGTLIWEASARRLPADLIVRRKQQLGVFVLEDSTVRFVHLPDAQEGRPAAHQLASNTKIVVSGQQQLSDGDAVVTQP